MTYRIDFETFFRKWKQYRKWHYYPSDPKFTANGTITPSITSTYALRKYQNFDDPLKKVGKAIFVRSAAVGQGMDDSVPKAPRCWLLHPWKTLQVVVEIEFFPSEYERFSLQLFLALKWVKKSSQFPEIDDLTGPSPPPSAQNYQKHF